MSSTRVVTNSNTLVTGTYRYKYFKRPIMPRVNAIPPQVLLAPTQTQNPMEPDEPVAEPLVKDMEVQTMYRESEAQTAPYAPDYTVQEGTNPEVLLLKDLTYENGLPLGKKEIEMIEYARAKKELEDNLPPFTDEASLNLRKTLMEQQEMREFKLREGEIDHRREQKLMDLERALRDREESNEFMNSQKIEGIRLMKMEEREKILQTIKTKRIKALRRLAHQRNVSDPILSDGTKKDIIDEYFDRGSSVYAPVKREGKSVLEESEKYDVASRTLPLDNIGNILSLEYTIPRNLTDTADPATLLSKTAPAGGVAPTKKKVGPVIRAAESRMTSAAQRAERITKRDVEDMHVILSLKKRDGISGGTFGMTNPVSRGNTAKSRSQTADGEHIRTAIMSKKPKGRPSTPDLTKNERKVVINEDGEEVATEELIESTDDFKSAVTLLQRLIRGRAVQNIMFEGKYRRKELINELQLADSTPADDEEEASYMQTSKPKNKERHGELQNATLDAVAGSSVSQLLHNYAEEKVNNLQ